MRTEAVSYSDIYVRAQGMIHDMFSVYEGQLGSKPRVAKRVADKVHGLTASAVDKIRRGYPYKLCPAAWENLKREYHRWLTLQEQQLDQQHKWLADRRAELEGMLNETCDREFYAASITGVCEGDELVDGEFSEARQRSEKVG